MRKLFAAVAALALIGCAGTREARVEDRERYTQAGTTNDQSDVTRDIDNNDDNDLDALDDDNRFDEPGIGGAGSEGVGDPGIDTDRGTPSADDFGAGGSGTQDDLGTGGAGMGEDDVGAGMDGELGTGGSGTSTPGTDMGTPGTDMGTPGTDMGTGGSGMGTDEMSAEERETEERRNPLRPGTTTIQGQTIDDEQ